MPVTVVGEGARLAAEAGDLSSRAIRADVVVPVPPNEAFRLWTTEEGLASWWMPRCRIRLEIGGPFELFFLTDAPEGSQGSEGCRILSFVPDRMVSFTWNAPPQMAHARSRYTWVVVEFSPVEGGTRVELTHLGWPESEWESQPEWQETFGYFEQAWANVLGLMRERLSG